jgi:hypothetical protein
VSKETYNDFDALITIEFPLNDGIYILEQALDYYCAVQKGRLDSAETDRYTLEEECRAIGIHIAKVEEIREITKNACKVG